MLVSKYLSITYLAIKECEKYMGVTEYLYLKKIIEEDIFEDLKDTYGFSNSKNHDYKK